MMSQIKKWGILILAFWLLIGCAALPAESLGSQEGAEGSIMPEEMAIDEFLASLEMDEQNNYIYPDYYGGLIFDRETRTYVIFVTDDSPDIAQDLYERFGTTNIRLQVVEYTYQELQSISGHIYEIAVQINAGTYGADAPVFPVWHLDPVRNRVVVGLLEYTEEQAAKFRETVLDHPAIEFEQGDYANPQ